MIKLGNTRLKGMGNEIRNFFLVFDKIESVGPWEMKHLMGMDLQVK